jgi:hypothetical protein
VPDVYRRVRGVQPGDVGAQLPDLGNQGLGLSHSTSIRIGALAEGAGARGRGGQRTGAGEYSFASRACLAENVYPALILAAAGRTSIGVTTG